VKRTLWRAVRWAIIGGVIVGTLLVGRPGDREAVLDGYLLFVGALALHLLVRLTQETFVAEAASAFERALRRPKEESGRPGDLVRLEREVFMATESAFDLHFRLRPVLREVAEHRLATRRGIDLERQRVAAHRALGPAWELVRPDRPAPDDRHGPGLPLRELRAAVDALETL
jgi:hypothetical protein